MANLHVASTGSNTAPYETWAKAATSLLTAVDAAAAGDTIYAHQETETISVDTVYALPNNCKIIGSNDTVNSPPQTLGTRTIDGSGTAGVDITINPDANAAIYVRGINLLGGGSTTLANINLHITTSGSATFENCSFTLSTTNTSSRIIRGNQGSSVESYCITRNCTFTYSHASQGITLRGGGWESLGDDFCGGATIPTALFIIHDSAGKIRIEGGDLSDITGTLFNAHSAYLYAELVNCKLGAGITIAAAYAHHGEGEIRLLNCDSGDAHYGFAHYSHAGSTVISTSIYANTGASYDGTNRHSWVVASNANSTFYQPYASPWIPVYHSGTSAITPSLEILRDGSATPYQDDEVWAEFSYQGTASSTRATLVHDRMAILGTAANQATGALAAGDWTGENATAWFGKLTPTATITPAEIGHLSARICIGEPSITVYVDPQIRTLI